MEFRTPLEKVCFSIMISKVQQRGIKATQDIIMKLLEGMNECDGQKVLIVDLNPSRPARLKISIQFFVGPNFQNSKYSYP